MGKLFLKVRLSRPPEMERKLSSSERVNICQLASSLVPSLPPSRRSAKKDQGGGSARLMHAPGTHMPVSNLQSSCFKKY